MRRTVPVAFSLAVVLMLTLPTGAAAAPGERPAAPAPAGVAQARPDDPGRACFESADGPIVRQRAAGAARKDRLAELKRRWSECVRGAGAGSGPALAHPARPGLAGAGPVAPEPVRLAGRGKPCKKPTAADRAGPPVPAAAPRTPVAPAVAAAEPGTIVPGAGQFVPLPPSAVVDNVTMVAGGVYTARLAGVGGVPEASEVSAVVLQVVAYAPTQTGYLRAYPADELRPAGVTVAYSAGRNASTVEVVGLSAGGEVSVYASAGTRLYVWLRGYFTSTDTVAAGGTYVPLPSERLAYGVQLAAGGTLDVQVTGVHGIPATGVSAVSFVVAGVAPTGPSFVASYPTGAARAPGHASVYVPTGEARAAQEIVVPNGSGKVTFYSLLAAKLYVWVRGYFQTPEGTAAGASYVPLAPAALLADAPVVAGGAATVQISGANGVGDAGSVAAVASNLGASGQTGSGYLATLPADAAPADASVYYAAGTPAYGLDTARVSGAGQIKVFSTAATAVTQRLRGYFRKATAPGAPGVSGAVGDDGRVLVTWAPPTADGGAVVTGYTVTASPGGRTATSTGEPSAIVDGLTNGTAYTFTVTATNAAGTGAPSEASVPVTPRPVVPPGAPTAVEAVAGDGGGTVSWQPPASDGGGPVESYTVTASPGGESISVVGTSAPIANLTNGTAYTFTVAAVNRAGAGPGSEPSAPITPRPTTAPAAPAGVTAAGRFDGAVVTWTRPDDGGDPITGYTVTAQPGGRTTEVAAPTTEAVVTGLDNGTAHTFTVTATNAKGTSAASAPSAPAMPGVTVPDPPLETVAVSGGPGTLTVSWQPPHYTGGQPLTGYVVKLTPGDVTVTTAASARSTQIRGLDEAVEYAATVTAVNATGAGTPSGTDAAVAPGGSVLPTTKVLTAAETASLSGSADDGTLTFTDAPAKVRALNPDDVLATPPVALAPDGLLRKVTAVRTSGGVTTVNTVGASLDEAVSEGSVSLNRQLTDADASRFQPAMKGVKAANVAGPEWALSLKDVDPGLGLKTTGQVSMRPSVLFDAKLKLFGNQYVKIGLAGDQKASLSFKATRSIKVECRGLLGTVPLGSQIFFAGPVPVVVVQSISFYLTGKVEVQEGLAAAVSWSGRLGGGLQYKDGRYSTFTEPTNFKHEVRPLDFTAGGSVELGLVAELDVKFEAVAGPFVSLKATATAQADIEANPWGTLTAKAEAGVGGKLEFIGKRFGDFEATMKLREWRLWSSRGPFFGVMPPDTNNLSWSSSYLATTQYGTAFWTPLVRLSQSTPVIVTSPGLVIRRRLDDYGEHYAWAVSPPAGVRSGAKYTITATVPRDGLRPAISTRWELTFGRGASAPRNLRIKQIPSDPRFGGKWLRVTFDPPLSRGDGPDDRWGLYYARLRDPARYECAWWFVLEPRLLPYEDIGDYPSRPGAYPSGCYPVLRAGRTYVFELRANNDYGEGEAAVSAPVTIR